MIEAKCFITDSEVVICEQDGLEIEYDDETHNCDLMGCSSVSHVIYAFSIRDSYQNKESDEK